MALSLELKRRLIISLTDRFVGTEIANAIDSATAIAALALPSASFTASAVTSKLITGFVSGAGSVAASDTILQALNKINGNVAAKADYSEPAVSLTFDHSVGATACVCRKIGKAITLEIPAIAITDGLGTVLSSGVGDLAAAARPAATISFPIVVNNNGGTIQIGLMTISSAGTVVIAKDLAGTGFTNAAAAGVNRLSVSYTVA